MQNINYQTQLLYDNIRNLINNSGLPIATAYYVVKDLFRDLEITYQQVYNQEAKQEASSSDNDIQEEDNEDGS